MQFITLSLSLLAAVAAAQDTATSSKMTKTLTLTSTVTSVSTCTVLLAGTDAPKPSAGMNYPLTNGTVATTTPVPSATVSGTGARAPTNVPYNGAASSAPQALFALAAGMIVLVASA